MPMISKTKAGIIGVVGVAILCAVGLIVHYTKMSSVQEQIGGHDDVMLGDNPSNEANVNQTVCVGTDYECKIRLDKNVLPLHYELFLHPDIEDGSFVGKVSILINVRDYSVDHIRLHTKYLNITESLLFRGLDSIPIKNIIEIPDKEYLVIIPEEKLKPSRYNLTLSFNGLLTRGLTGFYRASYVDPGTNDIAFMVTTKFQPTSARKAFPCFDEPGFKSTYTITIVKPNHWFALSNMPVEHESLAGPMDKEITVRFQKSVKMVTYLVVVAIGEFAFKIGYTKSKIPVRIFSTTSQVNKTDYATAITPLIIDFFEEYFNIPFPLEKLDILGIPDFSSGAMEHFGMISFREANLLYQPGVASAANKQRIATVIAHEVAHMWFGNLVTMEWWDDLYLNEGFASFMEFKGVNSVHPEWEIESQFGATDLTPVLKLDGQQSSHPIVQKVQHPDQITEIFDSISYNKGASVLRMLESFMTPAKFRHGVSQYLDEYAFGSTTTKDLWYFLQIETTQLNISLIMDTWTKQQGYPVLSVEIGVGSVKVTQELFEENRLMPLDKPSPFNYTWEIPLQISGPDSSTNTTLHWIHHNQTSIEIPMEMSPTWIKVNTGQFGYFRTNFHDTTWCALKDVYKTRFSPVERCGLLDDVMSLANARYLNYSTALDFITVVSKEDHYVPWDCLDPHLQKLNKLLRNAPSPTFSLYKKMVANLTSTAYQTFNWTSGETDPHLQRLLKLIIFSLSCENGETMCLDKTKELFLGYIAGSPANNEIPSDLRPIVYKWGMWQTKNESIWETVWQRYLVEEDAQEKIRLISCLASTQEGWILQKLLTYSMDERFIRRQDFFTAARLIAQSPVGNPIIWKFYRNEYKKLVERFSINDRYFGRMILDITGDFANEIRLNEMQRHFKDFPEAGAGRRARETAIESVQNSIQWLSFNVPTIEQWLNSVA